MFYLPNTPFWLRSLFPSGCTWKMPGWEKTVYLSFDDGPHPEATPFVLDQLNRFGAKASFFCIGKNVVQYPEIYKQIIADGHAVGNHTMNHANGYKCSAEDYVKEYQSASTHIGGDLFRPPYGRIKRTQIAALKQLNPGLKIIMWSVLTGDFDTAIGGELCLKYVKKYTGPGSILVFHDSAKALPRMRVALPATLKWLQQEGYECKAL